MKPQKNSTRNMFIYKKFISILFLAIILISSSGSSHLIYSNPSYDESFEYQLSVGWNLVSFPCIPEDASFSNILDDLPFYQVYTWDGAKYIQPSVAEPGLGYWVFVIEDTPLQVANGAPVDSFELNLQPGWNMIGSLFSYIVDADLVFPGFYQLYSWDGSSYSLEDTIEPGKGYWAFVASSTSITVDETSAIITNTPPQADYLQILHEPPQLGEIDDQHECRMWGMVSEVLPYDAVMDHLVDMPYSLKNLGAANDDGWGLIYYYTDEAEFIVYRDDNQQASTDPEFNVAAEALASSGERLAVGHVRNAASGATDIPNPHPFIRERGGRYWAFSHNGVVSKTALYNLIGDDYLYQFEPPSYAPSGWYDIRVVDTDLYHIFMIKCMEECGWNVRAGIAKAVVDLNAAASGSMNFLLSDGETLWGFRKGNTLCYKHYTGDDPYSAVASEPPEGSFTSGWVSMSDWNLVELTADSAPVYISDIRTLYPPVYDSLTASYTYYDNDGDPESGTEIRWYKEDVLQPHLNDLITVPSEETTIGEEWYFTVRPSDGEDFGELMTSPSVTIGDTVAVYYETQMLVPVDPDGVNGDYRWMDVADQPYSSAYIENYLYADSNVQITYTTHDTTFSGLLVAQNLKPNFAYQLKLTCTPGTVDNECIGLVGRWWEQEWTGSDWSTGSNLNNKGDGSSPNPNDETYLERRHIEDLTSSTGYRYKYTGYLVFNYFITDENGGAYIPFSTGSCYHVLWKTTQSWPYTEGDDGPIKQTTFNPATSSPAYDLDYPEQTVALFGEYERLPMGNTPLPPGEYTCSIMLTEESFHSQLGDPHEGNWAASVTGEISFTIRDAESL